MVISQYRCLARLGNAPWLRSVRATAWMLRESFNTSASARDRRCSSAARVVSDSSSFISSAATALDAYGTMNQRSEEHTSELQSPCNLVCRLLLEKKKNEIQCTHADFIASRRAGIS